MRLIVTIAVAVCAVFAQSASVRAGLYHRDTIAAPDIDENGFAKALDIDTFLTIVNIIKKTDNLESEEAKRLLESIRDREKRIARLNPQEQIALWIDMLRLRTDEAHRVRVVNELQKLRLPPEGMEFLVYTHLAHAHMVNGSFQEAAVADDSAINDFTFPKQMLGLSKAQLDWYRRLEKDYNLPFLRNRNEEALRKGKLIDELDPIFPGRKPGKMIPPVHFVGESGAHEAGSIAAAEKAKLPPDAIAIVQQLILWKPDDGRLWWLLAELYNAAGDLKSSAHVFKLCEEETEFRQRRNRELRDHRAIVMAALPAYMEEIKRRQQAEEEKNRLAQEEEQRRIEAEKTRKRQEESYEYYKTIWVKVGVAAVLVFVGYWQVREFARRIKARRGRTIQHSKGNG